MRRFFTVIALSAALVSPVAAEEFSRTIPVSPSDLTDPAAADALYEKITEAAKALCAKANPPLFSYVGSTRADRAACVRDSVNRAVGMTASPFLAARHTETLAGKPVATTVASR
jgi:UrcA family protein